MSAIKTPARLVAIHYIYEYKVLAVRFLQRMQSERRIQMK